ncbi:hypothetical protein [Microbacterium sp. K24]|uniref:hypothetical protein n=1 Tax=Microbacterium sp. K24 TaxID=2305446 RepID=UPI00109CF0B8|nr:hypothetical protein [Microbacterium sp. K24]
MTSHHRRFAPVAAFVALALSLLSGCSPLPVAREAGTPMPRPSADPTPTSQAGSPRGGLSFAEGATLDPRADISWGDGFVADDGWRAQASQRPGRWSYVNAAGTCTASYRGGALGDAGGMDDREATDALIEYQSGDDFLAPEMLTDGEFAAYEGDGSGIAHRQFSYTVNEFGYFMAARAFVEADYSVWVIVTCEGEPVGPVAQEVLSKNVIAIDAPKE